MSDIYRTFKYTSDPQGVLNLVIGTNHDTVANGVVTKPMDAGSWVVACARVDNKQYVTIGKATGKILDLNAKDIWTDWHNPNAVVHGVKWERPVLEYNKDDYKFGANTLPTWIAAKIVAIARKKDQHKGQR